MRSYIKSSFFMVLLLALFSVGFSSAHAKTVKKDKKVTKTTTIKTVPLRCQVQSVVNIAAVFNTNNQTRSQSLEQLFTAYSPCEARLIFLNDGTIIEIDGNCNITIYFPPVL